MRFLIVPVILALFFKVWDYVRFYRLSSAGNDIATSNNELFKQIKRRFMDCQTLNRPINNTLVYVEKCFYAHAGFSTLNRLSLLSFGSFYILLWLYFEKGFIPLEKLSIYGIAIFVLYYISDKFFDTTTMKKCFISSVTDYLDNSVKSRFSQTNTHQRRAELNRSSMQTAATTPPDVYNNNIDKSSAMDLGNVSNNANTFEETDISATDTSIDEELITSIINEFL